MPWAAGTYTKGNNGTGGWTGDASLGIGIEAGRHDTQDNDFATGINQCLNKDGSNSCTGDLNLGGFKPVNVAAGTAAAPAICAGGDVNTGIFSAAADQIGIATNGTERVRIDASGKVLVGRTTPVIGETIGSTGYGIVGSTTGDGQFIFGSGGSSTVSGSYDNTPHIFRTNNTERMRISSTGQVGIGGTPSVFTHFYAVSATAGRVAGRFYVDTTSDLPTAAIILDKKDNNNTTSQVFLQATINSQATANGQINGNGASQLAFGSWSDIRLKENIESLPNQLENLLALRPVEFDYKDGSGHQIGFIAQEVQEIYPDLVGETPDGMLTLSGLGKWESRLVKAIQELSAKVEALEARVAELEAA